MWGSLRRLNGIVVNMSQQTVTNCSTLHFNGKKLLRCSNSRIIRGPINLQMEIMCVEVTLICWEWFIGKKNMRCGIEINSSSLDETYAGLCYLCEDTLSHDKDFTHKTILCVNGSFERKTSLTLTCIGFQIWFPMWNILLFLFTDY